MQRVLSVLAASLLSCQLVLPSDSQQCRSNSDCSSRGGAFPSTVCEDFVCRVQAVDAGKDKDVAVTDPKWGCIGNVKWLPQSSVEKVLHRERFLRLIGDVPVVGVQVSACASVDPECQSPVSNGVTDDKGDAVLSIPRNFRGFFQASKAPPTLSTMIPTLVALYPPPDVSSDLSVDPVLGTTNVLLARSELDTLLLQGGGGADFELGHVFASTLDCTGTVTGGVALRSSVRGPKTIPFYLGGNGAPSIDAQQTDATGVGGFFNLPNGNVTIEAQLPALVRKVGDFPVLIKKGTITLLNIVPTP
jgi:hypothetical protein